MKRREEKKVEVESESGMAAREEREHEGERRVDESDLLARAQRRRNEGLTC